MAIHYRLSPPDIHSSEREQIDWKKTRVADTEENLQSSPQSQRLYSAGSHSANGHRPSNTGLQRRPGMSRRESRFTIKHRVTRVR